MFLRRGLNGLKGISRGVRGASLGAIWLAAVLVAATLGQSALISGEHLPGFIFYSLAGLMLVLLAQRAGYQPPELNLQARGSLTRRTLALVGVAYGLVGITCIWVWQPNSTLLERQAMLVFWLGGLLIFTGAIVQGSSWQLPKLQNMGGWAAAHRRELAGILALGGLALSLRMIDLEQHPYAFANDEGWIGVEGWRIITGDITHWFRVGWSSQPNLSFVPATISMLVLGKTLFAVRLVSAVEGALSVVFTYLVGREAFGKRVGWLGAGLLAVMPVHIHFSRTGFNNILPGFYVTLLVWLVLRALRRGEISTYLWAGLATGSAFYTYLGNRLAMLLAVGILGYAVLFRRGYWRAHLAHLLVFAGAVVLVCAPMITYFIKDPNQFMARINADGILQNGWLVIEAQRSGRGEIGLLWEQLTKSLLGFISDGGGRNFYNSPDPYLPAFIAIFAVLGMATSLARLRRLPHVILQAWFWGLILTGGMLTNDPPQHQRLVMAYPAAALLAALGLEQITLVAARLRLGAQRLWQVLAILVVAAAGVYGVGFYFGEYRQQAYYSDLSNEIALESAQLAQLLPTPYRLALLTAPEVFLEFANFRFFVDGRERVEFRDLNGAGLGDAVRGESPSIYVAIQERRADLEAVAKALPGGQWIEAPSRMQVDQPLFYAYVTPAIFPPLPNLAPDDTALQTRLWIFWGCAFLLGGCALFLGLKSGMARGRWRERLVAWYHAPLPDLAGIAPPVIEIPWESHLRQMLKELQVDKETQARLAEPHILSVSVPPDPMNGIAEIEMEVTLEMDQKYEIEIQAEPDGTEKPPRKAL